MRAIDVNSLFARAQQSFGAGHVDRARAELLDVQRLAGAHPAVLHLLALVEKRRRDLPAARVAFERALAMAPRDPQISSNFANLLAELGEQESALACYGRALELAPHHHEARYNRALLLQKLGRLDDALADLDAVIAAQPGEAKAHSARGSVLRALRRLDEAARAYDAALALDPKRVTALHGRARVAMERGDPDGSDHYRRALAVRPDDPELSLGLAEALEAEGRPGAADVLGGVVARHPTWTEGQESLARMRWEAGQGESFTRDFEQAVKLHPRNRALWLAYASALAAAGFSGRAADVAAEARTASGEDPSLRLLEAMHASEAGELARADRLFDELPRDMRGRSILEIRHRVRTGDYPRALALADQALAEEPWDIGAWAMTGLLWRLTGDPRAEWLLLQPGLVSTRALELTPEQIDMIAHRLRGLHTTRAHPIGQSLRGGTQTRGRLFERDEPEVVLLRDAIRAAVDRHWNDLPPTDPRHPLLRHRDRQPRFDGSWSVRLTGGGFHISHIHPRGLLSSACYLVVPKGATEQEGWLEVGGRPDALPVPIEPIRRIEPTPGRLALFPSYMFHGTRPFSAGERLTAAFDISVS
ncbi:MAG TPA: tetratricopeptide repeat protein [Allosphingosinicella sp.]|jgi:tetratricopeptide (TPR) repeat protein|uniref:tetratricopeptide repeat protein n=1 Tax=Allosphingosinicella sp. TaxID=2823234 RepID=UPI002F28C186